MLLLRQVCQPILDSYGLSDLHVVILDKTLTIVGGCGKPLISISGITFSKSSISEKERTFALSLFESFMLKHSAAIISYVTEKKAFTSLPELVLPTDYSYSVYNGGSLINTAIPHGELKIYPSGKITYSTGNTSLSPDVLKDLITAIEKDIPACVLYLTEFSIRSEQSKALDLKRQALAQCNI